MREDLPGLSRWALAWGAGGSRLHLTVLQAVGSKFKVLQAECLGRGPSSPLSDGRVSHVPSYKDADPTVGGSALRPRHLREASAPHSTLGVQLSV